ncbi:thiamine pyrophosphate-binding protein [Thioclava nitratireducens]|uniref:thiamine pyrophosphate-binding protein n=1 Tax=Thioclava nitratireducens TaxID=1915078 RepID=UPI00248093E3|nr:thiamine pyrophosphate-dependent enzyme [Thioclava nitratireducens]WGT52633.1 thiamine pyrophosphate-binding protein [Thioclava nitratireducens]
MNDLTPQRVETPLPSEDNGVWGSDIFAEVLRGLGVKYVALNPGSSFRGLHDSLVNKLGNHDPQMLLCLHEEHAVAIAHGYAKVTGEPLAVILHSNVGLMHGTMAIFNAWCDRVPVLIYGATGPVDAAMRRPWIDWLHTCRDQASMIRNYVKWDDQPASMGAAIESMLRADVIARTAPFGPTYVNFDVSIQEKQHESVPALPDYARYQPPMPADPSAKGVAQAAELLKGAKNPVILAGRVSRDPADWARRVALAEALGAEVLSDIRIGASFPTDHPLHRGKPAFFIDDAAGEVLRSADVILSLDWLDVAGTLKLGGEIKAKVIQASIDYQLHNGWGMEHQALPALDLHLASTPDAAVHAIADALGVGAGTLPEDLPVKPALDAPPADTPLDIMTLAGALGEGLDGVCASMVRLPLGWAGESWHFRHPLDFLGSDGGAGIGSGPGMLIGAALALKDSDRLPVAVLGDGDFMMAASAFWTAAHYGTPFLAVVSNNRSFYNDEVHQERVAVARNRPVENKWIGQRIGDPDIDIAGVARAQGCEGIGPVTTAGELVEAVRKGIAMVQEGKSVVIDARVQPGYNPNMVAGLTRSE